MDLAAAATYAANFGRDHLFAGDIGRLAALDHLSGMPTGDLFGFAPSALTDDSLSKRQHHTGQIAFLMVGEAGSRQCLAWDSRASRVSPATTSEPFVHGRRRRAGSLWGRGRARLCATAGQTSESALACT